MNFSIVKLELIVLNKIMSCGLMRARCAYAVDDHINAVQPSQRDF
jgi:hypothetical protein